MACHYVQPPELATSNLVMWEHGEDAQEGIQGSHPHQKYGRERCLEAIATRGDSVT